MHVLIPVKSLDHAKSRLQGVLGPHERRELASCLLDDTLATLSVISWIERILVVTSNDRVAHRATERGAVAVEEPDVLRDPSDPHGPLNAALEAGRRWAVDDGALILASLPVDLPLLPAVDADHLAQALGLGDVARRRTSEAGKSIWLQTDEERDGTNLLVQDPIETVPFRYGAASFRRHREEAERVDARVVEVDEPALVWDLDHPDDPERWAQSLRHDAARRRLHERARERGTALRFLEQTAWGAPLKPPHRAA